MDFSIFVSIVGSCEGISCSSPSLGSCGFGRDLLVVEEVAETERHRRGRPRKDIAAGKKKKVLGASIEDVVVVLVVEVSHDKGFSLILSSLMGLLEL